MLDLREVGRLRLEVLEHAFEVLLAREILFVLSFDFFNKSLNVLGVLLDFRLVLEEVFKSLLIVNVLLDFICLHGLNALLELTKLRLG